MADKPKKRQDSSKATKKPQGTPSLSVGERFRQRKPLTLEEQKALGLDTGPVVYVSTVPRGLRPKPKPKKD